MLSVKMRTARDAGALALGRWHWPIRLTPKDFIDSTFRAIACPNRL